MARIRLRVFLILLLLCVAPVLYSAPLLLRLYYLLRLPFVWKASSNESIISLRRDDFDITFSNFSAAYSTADAEIRPLIPAKLHHIHLGSNPPRPEWVSAREECIRWHEAWDTFLWNDESASRFVMDSFPHLYDMWQSYPFMVQRVDALRYMVLEKHGGVVLDFDLACKRSLEPLRRFDFVAPAAHPTGVSVGMLLASPNNSFVKSLVDNLPKYNRRWLLLPYVTVMFSTGCHYASTIFTLQSNRSSLRVLAGTSQAPVMHMLNGLVETPLFRHLGSSSWHSTDARLIALFKNIDQRLVFFILLLLMAGVISLILCASAARNRSSPRSDVESYTPQTSPKISQKHA